ncbi:hypothetical protein BHE74_00018639 [Ensete ventricosum]|nr:hypothetical protein BHE74_00018639 [Ensete ventricosum]
MKKHDGYKLCVKSSSDRFFAPSQNFKILAIPNVLAHGKSYDHGFVKKRDGHKLCLKSHFSIDLSCTLSKFQNTSH